MKLKYAGLGIVVSLLIAMIFICIHFQKPIEEGATPAENLGPGGAGFYTNGELGFETRVPDDWEEYLSFSDWVVFKTEREPDALVDVKLEEVEPGTALEEKAQLLRAGAEATGILLHENFILVGGVNAWEMIERFSYRDNERERFAETWNIFLIRNEMLWRISFGVFKNEENEVDQAFARLELDFKEFVRTFKFI